MIKLRKRPPIPKTLKSATVKQKEKELADKVATGSRVVSEDFDHYWLKDDVRRTLWTHHKKKCCYCERKRELTHESDVEHYRPKAGVTKEPDHPGYWWLAYRWNNYLYACKPCNEAHKKNHFPILGMRAKSKKDSLSKEKPIIINPIDENPEKFIGFDWFDIANKDEKIYLSKATGKDIAGRGKKTIELMQLNRDFLLEERGKLITILLGIATKMMAGKHLGNPKIIKDAASDIKRETSSEQPFSGLRRAFFRKLNLDIYIAND